MAVRMTMMLKMEMLALLMLIHSIVNEDGGDAYGSIRKSLVVAVVVVVVWYAKNLLLRKRHLLLSTNKWTPSIRKENWKKRSAAVAVAAADHNRANCCYWPPFAKDYDWWSSR